MAPLLSAHQRRFVDRLYHEIRARGCAPERILAPFQEIPRHWFVAQLCPWDARSHSMLGCPLDVRPDTEDGALLDRVYADAALCIQVRRDCSTSSSSQPSLMAQMMAEIGLAPGMKVLEIGTATGWNAALMGQVVGPRGRVVSIEYDRDLADAARARLACYGLDANVTVLCGDGVAGVPAEAPFDAILATVACPDVPRVWLSELAEGGCLLLPYELPTSAAPLLRLRRSGERWTGAFGGWTWFVALRGGGLEPWPEPLEVGRDPRLAALLDETPVAVPLPRSGLGWDGPQSENLALYLLAAVPGAGWLHVPDGPHGAGGLHCGLATSRTGDPSLAVVLDSTLAGFGAPSARERLAAGIAAWQAAGQPRIGDYQVAAQTATTAQGELVLRRPQTALVLTCGCPR